MKNVLDESVILRSDVFPIQCKNPFCNRWYTQKEFIDVFNESGLIHGEFDEKSKFHNEIFQGITCPRCKNPLIKFIPKIDPIVDLREFIISPNPDLRENNFEQIFEIKNREKKPEYLRFQFIPGWNQETVSLDDIERVYCDEDGKFQFQHSESIPYLFFSKNEVFKRINDELETSQMKLRRFFPNVNIFKNMMKCIAHNKITHVFPDINFSMAEENTSEEILDRNQSWIALFDEIGKGPLKDLIKRKLNDSGIKDVNKNNMDTIIINPKLLELRYMEIDRFKGLMREVGFEKKIWKYLENLFSKFFYMVTTEIALQPRRDELLDWPNKVKAGKALLVDAPMGLGKTYSISEVLADNQEISTVVFMPTKKLCEDLVEELKTKIAIRKGIDIQRLNDREQIIDENHQVVKDEYGIPEYRWKRNFLQDEVYYVDGINEIECPFYTKIINSYRRGIPSKKYYCKHCVKAAKSICRFLQHDDSAKQARIIITTHAQYDKYYSVNSLHYWYKFQGSEKDRDKRVKRNLFIVDEDLVIPNCYQPVQIEYSDLVDFVKEFNDFIEEVHGPSDIIDKIDDFLGKVTRCKGDAIIPPIDPNFTIPKNIIKEWKDELDNQYYLVSERLDEKGPQRDFSEVLAHAIKVGASVQKYYIKDRKIHRVYFPNPTVYDLSKLPPHVFFDGTMLDKKLLEPKLKKISFEYLKIKSDPLWKLNVRQNVNTDLPKTNTYKDMNKVKQFIRELISQLGKNHKFFFLTTKHIRQSYLEQFLKTEFPRLNHVLCHYRYIKGINDAKDCDVGIMVGSYILSTAVESALALELLQKEINLNKVIIKSDELWSYKGPGKPQRHYKKDYQIIEELANTLRFSEYKQGIARTRYISHDVDFYVLSKDLVSKYEPTAKIIMDQYRADLFPPRKKRHDTKKLEVKEAVEKWLAKNSYVRIANIQKITKISERIVRGHLNELVEENFLVREKRGIKGGVYTYPPKMKRVIFQDKKSTALNRQAKIGQYGFPFTLNPNIGCFYACKYCYVPAIIRNKLMKERFFNEVTVKTWMPQQLDYELNQYRDLPQHLKRVQINESCESYLPKVMKETKNKLKRDLMAEILHVFEKHWNNGNQWMLHIITKSHLVLRHIDLLSRLKHMVQVEISFSTFHEEIRRQIERFAPLNRKRLDTVKRLSDEGIFVRVMAMPFVESQDDCKKLRIASFDNGAKAFKHKGLNYYDLEDLTAGKIYKKYRRKDLVWMELNLKSGEYILENDEPKKISLPMPENWKPRKKDDYWKYKLVEKDMEMIDCGYSECNDVDWGYVI